MYHGFQLKRLSSSPSSSWWWCLSFCSGPLSSGSASRSPLSNRSNNRLAASYSFLSHAKYAWAAYIWLNPKFWSCISKWVLYLLHLSIEEKLGLFQVEIGEALALGYADEFLGLVIPWWLFRKLKDIGQWAE
jgi:hypothetical protein